LPSASLPANGVEPYATKALFFRMCHSLLIALTSTPQIPSFRGLLGRKKKA